MEIIRERVEARLAALHVNRWEAAKSAGFDRAFINDIIVGRKKRLQPRSLERLAEILECSPEYLVGAADQPGTPATVNAPRPTRGVLPLAGVLETGAFREQTPDDLVETAGGIAPDARYPDLPQMVFVVADKSLDQRGINVGDFLICVDADEFQREHGPLNGGSLVVIETRQGNLIERRAVVLTYKEGDAIGEPHSTFGSFQSVRIEGQTRIVAVAKALRRVLI